MRNVLWSPASLCLSVAAWLYYCMDPDVTWGSGRGCPLVVHYWADLQLGHGLRCYGNITQTRNVSEYMLVLALCLVYLWFLQRNKFPKIKPINQIRTHASLPMLPFTFTQNNCFAGRASSLRKKVNCDGSTGFRSKLKSWARILCMNVLWQRDTLSAL